MTTPKSADPTAGGLEAIAAAIAKGEVRRGLEYVFVSPNESDSNLEPANVVDGLYFIGRAIHHLAKAIEGSEK